jgi:hypothetical protein
MNESPFHDKLFQRGQTWQECLECWPYHRERILKQAAQAKPLSKTQAFIKDNKISGKWLLIYSVRSTDSLMALPFIAPTWPETSDNILRLFCYEYFFPQFEHLPNRAWPALHILQNHRPRYVWGPRPKNVDALVFDDKDGRTFDKMLLTFDQDAYYQALDEEMVQALKSLNLES